MDDTRPTAVGYQSDSSDPKICLLYKKNLIKSINPCHIGEVFHNWKQEEEEGIMDIITIRLVYLPLTIKFPINNFHYVTILDKPKGLDPWPIRNGYLFLLQMFTGVEKTI